MDAFLYPELFYGNVTSNNSLFKVNNTNFDPSNNSNKRFVNLNHKLKLNPVEAQKLNSELLKFNYGTRASKDQGQPIHNSTRRNSTFAIIQTTAVDLNETNLKESLNVEKCTLPKLHKTSTNQNDSDLRENSKNSLNKQLNKSDPALSAETVTAQQRQSLEISPISVDLQTNANGANAISNNNNNKRYFYRLFYLVFFFVRFWGVTSVSKF